MKTILIVDDEVDILTFLSALFEDHGYQTIQAANGVEAIALAKSQKPDLITLDMTMPEQSGVKTLRELKGDPQMQKIPVIVVTGIGESMQTFMNKVSRFPQPEGFLTKPIDQAALLALVAKLLV